MKNRLIITISDINGSIQYSVHEIIKKIIVGVILLLITIAFATYLYINFLNNKVTKLNSQKVEFQNEIIVLEEKSATYKHKNDILEKQNLQLTHLIQENSDKLASVNEKLQEVEEMIGYGPDLNASFQARLEEEREETAQSLKEKLVDFQIQTIQKVLFLNSIPNGKPLDYKRISSTYGYRTHPITKRNSFHPALDLKARKGTPVYAPANGVVVYAKRKGAYGNFLLLAHSFGFKTAYGHLSGFAVKSGDYVNKGDLIAYVGSTGRSTGPHLHYEIRYLEKWLNPKPFISWDEENIYSISEDVPRVKWKSILGQIEKIINLSNEQKDLNGTVSS
ncbi:peptidoglycan DD-metalloendopeptidase family protein [Sulfurovum sp. zt1-1]|uniref:Peptidoglycan DD-metalloendopeptidase family protein n=1 Tax=Sulfurovum zhangzhouensis TaxID=3019067 RepID=A0ABT7QW19_9BACT|nr:M23 family metallopeptidase [Sulfurovum zhangzhouensis]MDM5271034.1 peptidoglycan DD-metalloendopeptidase family protein [Sulfurovum zhangzhouensis]